MVPLPNARSRSYCGSQFHNTTLLRTERGAGVRDFLPVKVFQSPADWVPKSWLLPRPSLHSVFWSSVG